MPNGKALPDYAKLRITGNFNGWGTDLTGEENVLTAVDASNGEYSYDFGKLREGSTLEYKLVATNEYSVSFWDFELSYHGSLTEKENNPYFEVSATDKAKVTGCSFVDVPARFHVSVTIDGLALPEGGYLQIHGTFTKDGWSLTTLAQKEGNAFEGYVGTRIKTSDFGFRVMDAQGAQVPDNGWIAKIGKANLTLSVTDNDLSFVLSGTMDGVDFVA